ncbi:hypothetical protein GCM10022245_02560 [Streptomyces mayteni]
MRRAVEDPHERLVTVPGHREVTPLALHVLDHVGQQLRDTEPCQLDGRGSAPQASSTSLTIRRQCSISAARAVKTQRNVRWSSWSSRITAPFVYRTSVGHVTIHAQEKATRDRSKELQQVVAA